MIEQRKFHRVPLSKKAILSHKNNLYQGELENISMNGALIRLKHGTDLLQGDTYKLDFYIDDDAPLHIDAEVVCVNFSMAGIRFSGRNSDALIRLSGFIERLASDPDLAIAEHERNRRHLANIYRDE